MHKSNTNKLTKIMVIIGLSIAITLSALGLLINTQVSKAEANTNPSNEFGCIIDAGQYNLVGNYDIPTQTDIGIVFNDNKHLLNYYSEINDDFAKTPYTAKINWSKSFFEITDTYTNRDTIYVQLIYNVEGLADDYPFVCFFAPMETADKIADVRWLLNGKTIEFEYNEPIYMTEQNHIFTTKIKYRECTIAGNVVDETGNPIDGAKITLSPNNPSSIAPQPVFTTNGRFEFDVIDTTILPATLSVEKEGYTCTPIAITIDDIVEGTITIPNLQITSTNQPEPKASEIAKTNDTYALPIALIALIAACMCLTTSIKRLNN